MSPPTKESIERLCSLEEGYGTEEVLQALLECKGSEEDALEYLRSRRSLRQLTKSDKGVRTVELTSLGTNESTKRVESTERVGPPGGGHEQASLISKIFFLWTNPLVSLAGRQPLEEIHLWDTPQNSRVVHLLRRFDRCWAAEIAKAKSANAVLEADESNGKPKKRRQPSLMKSFRAMFFSEVLYSGMLQLAYQGCVLASPLLMRRFLAWFADEKANTLEGYLLASGLFVVPLIGSGVIWSHCVITLYKVGMDIRTTLNAVIYRKALGLSNEARQESTTGEVVNLMSADSEKIPMACITMHSTWVVPLFLAVAIWLLTGLVGGTATGCSIASMFAVLPIQIAIAIKTKTVTREQMVLTDDRVKLVNEVLQGIKIVKLYAWEKPFAERIQEIRRLEVKKVVQIMMYGAYNLTVMLSVPTLMTLVMLMVYYKEKGEFDGATVFTAMAVLYLIRMPLMMLPMAIGSYVMASVSLTRIKRFLLLPDNAEAAAQLLAASTSDDKDLEGEALDGKSGGPGCVEVWGQFTWSAVAENEGEGEGKGEGEGEGEGDGSGSGGSGGGGGGGGGGSGSGGGAATAIAAGAPSEKSGDEAEGESLMADATPKKAPFSLSLFDGSGGSTDTPLVIKPGQLVAVVGQVGSGKTSFLSSILGEMTALGPPLAPGDDSAKARDAGDSEAKGAYATMSPGTKTAYAAQSAWIVNATLKENILFGYEFDSLKYHRTIDVCALAPDLRELEAGEETEIGEKGINLSGGQQARVSLARAVYADADLYMLDDIFSAVDAHVGKHLFKHCVGPSGILKDKTRIMCTNQLHLVPQADVVLVLHGGVISEQGSYDELMAADGSFAQLMRDYGDAADQGSNETVSDAVAAAADDAGLFCGNSSAKAEDLDPQTSKMRSMSSDAGAEPNAKTPRARGQLTVKEEKALGSVDYTTWLQYFSTSSGGPCLLAFLVFTTIVAQGVEMVFNWWLSKWTDAFSEVEADNDDNDDERLGDFKLSMDDYMMVYGCLGLATVVFALGRQVTFAYQAGLASRGLFKNLLKGVFGTRMEFFDTTPIGRILNRFSKDTVAIDTQLPQSVPNFVVCFGAVMGVFLMIVVLLPWFAVAMVPIMGLYFYTQQCYRPISRDLQRIESVSRSPIFAQFSETLHGVATIRAYGKQTDFLKQCYERIDKANNAFFLMHNANRWLQLRLESQGALIVFATALLLVLSRASWAEELFPPISVGLCGLLLTYTQQVTGLMNWAVRMGCETEARMTSVERLQEYAEIPAEETLDASNIDRANAGLPPNFPAQGGIRFQDVEMRYRDGLPLVLKGVTLDIAPGSKIGICGRTGSGKSTLTVALYRLVQLCKGTIYIDGHDTSQLGLETIRRALAIIPQDPVLFVGTMRENLDAFGEYEDHELWTAIDQTENLRQTIEGLPDGLSSKVAEGGENFSVGQRQLICLARALLRKPKILIMDEATANIDLDTDNLIQKMVREKLGGCTILTIAHRLHTIMDSDKILVMDAGRVAEFDSPAALLAKPESYFSKLVADTGDASAARLKTIAGSAQSAEEAATAK